jgi:hypothetical protein
MTSASRRTMPLILRGMLLIARGQARGLNCFRDTPRAYLASLAPGFGLLLGATIEALAEGAGANAFAEIPASLCVLLAPSVLSYELARFWGREAFWNRYIVAFNWCQWLLPLFALLLIFVSSMAQIAGAGGANILTLLLFGLGCYALWLNWFIARHGLALSGWRAALMVAVVNLGTMTILLVHVLLAAGSE